jgi:hypothetical protein
MDLNWLSSYMYGTPPDPEEPQRSPAAAAIQTAMFGPMANGNAYAAAIQKATPAPKPKPVVKAKPKLPAAVVPTKAPLPTPLPLLDVAPEGQPSMQSMVGNEILNDSQNNNPINMVLERAKRDRNSQGYSAELIDPAVLDEAQRRVAADPGLQSQKEMMKMQQEFLTNYLGQKQSQDLSPLLALNDAWTGANLSKAYQRPETQQEQFQKGAAILQKVLEGRQKLTDDERDLMKAQLINYNKTGDVYSLLNELTTGRKPVNPMAGRSDAVEAQARRDMRDLDKIKRESDADFAKIEGALTTGSPQAISAIKSNLARVIGREKGALSEGDVGRSILQDYGMDIDTFLFKLGEDVKYDAKSLKYIRRLVSEAKQIDATRHKQGVEDLKDIYRPSVHWNAVAPIFNTAEGKADKGLKAAAPQKSPKELLMEKWLKEDTKK